MAPWLVIGLFLSVVEADYECVCNYNVEQSVLPYPSSQAQPLGYLYEFDCKPTFSVKDLDREIWHSIAFEGQVGYIHADPNIQEMICAGQVNKDDQVTTKETTVYTTVSTHNTKLSPTVGTRYSSSDKPDKLQTTTLQQPTPSAHKTTSEMLTSDLSGLSSVRPAVFSTSDLSGLSSVRPEAFSTSDLSGLSSVRPEAFSTSDLSGLSSVRPAVFSTSDLSGLSSVRPAVFSTSDLSGLSSVRPAASSTSDLSGLSSVRPAVFSTSDLSGLSSVRPAVFSTSDLSRLSSVRPAASSTSDLSGLSSVRPAASSTSNLSGSSSLNSSAYSTTPSSIPLVSLSSNGPNSSGSNYTTASTTQTSVNTTVTGLHNTTLLTTNHLDNQGGVNTNSNGTKYTSSTPPTNETTKIPAPEYTSSGSGTNETATFNVTRFTSSTFATNETTTIPGPLTSSSASASNQTATVTFTRFTSPTLTTNETALHQNTSTPIAQKIPTTYPVPHITSTTVTTKLTTTKTTTTVTTKLTTTTTTTPRPTTPPIIGNISLCPAILLTYTTEDEGALTQYSHHCYELVTTKLIWTKAELDCQAKSGHLLSIHTKQFQEYIYNWVSRFAVVPSIWLGLSDLRREGRFEWTSGGSLVTPYWYKDPSSSPADTTQDCVRMVFGSPEWGRWDTSDCGQTTPTGDLGSQNAFICQFPIQPRPLSGQLVG